MPVVRRHKVDVGHYKPYEVGGITYNATLLDPKVKTHTNKLGYLASSAAYEANPAGVYNVRLRKLGYTLDTELSNAHYRVYSHPEHTLIGYRGTNTSDYEDINSDLGIAFGNINTQGIRAGVEVAQAAKKKYNKPLLHAGHSLGGTKAIVAQRYTGGHAVAFNPGTGFGGLNAGDADVFTRNEDVIGSQVYGSRIHTSTGGHSLADYEKDFDFTSSYTSANP